MAACDRLSLHTPRVSAEGMTLIELLLTMVILGLLAGTLATTLRSADTARDRALDAVTNTRQAQAALDLLRQDLLGARIVFTAANDKFLGEDEGEMDTVEFVTSNARLPSGDQLMDLTLVLWALEPEDEDDLDGVQQYQLVRYTTGNVYQTNDLAYEGQTVLRGLSGWQVRYLGTTGWADDWDSSQTGDLPSWAQIRFYRDPPENILRERQAKGEKLEAIRLLNQGMIRLPMGPKVDTFF